MFEQLKAMQGKNIILELNNGRMLPGMVIDLDEDSIRFDTSDGVGIIPVSNVQIIWEPAQHSLTEEDMEVLTQKLRDKIKAESGLQQQGDIKTEIACISFPAFTCSQRYICRPPDTCTFSFACPGNYVPGFPSAGGGCPIFLCGPFQFGQPCRPFIVSCGPFQFGQPCRPFIVSCGPFQFGQPCGPFTFNCGPFQFGQPCGPFTFGGSQCVTPGGFVCAGQQFFGLVGPPGMA
ncbi:MAG: hypothetical protein PHO01_06865 [Desulfotomaculaceae bacterium]|nr:hypothetical protein [Desulfotomaculaceae bacterium]